jgi:hypothetical protein
MGCGGAAPIVADDPGIPPASDGVDGVPPDPELALPDAAEPEASLQGTYLDKITIDLDPNAGPDLDNDGQGDNALGDLFTSIELLTGATNINESIAYALEDGLLNLGLVWDGIQPKTPLDQAAFNLQLILLQAPDGEPGTQNVFHADPNSFVAGTNVAKTVFKGAAVTNGQVQAAVATFHLSFPYYDVPVNVLIGKAAMDGTATTDALGIALTNGTLSGAVSANTFLDWANAYVNSEQCTCITGLQGDLIDTSQGLGPEACIAKPDAGGCSEDDESTCILFVEQCTVLMPIIAAYADIDTDADGVPDSFSALVHLEGVGATITGIPQ